MKNQTIDVIKLAQEKFPDAMLVEGFDEALIGFSIRLPSKTNFVYSISKIINILMKRDGMGYVEAEEYYAFNIEGAYFGDDISPVYIDDRHNYKNN